MKNLLQLEQNFRKLPHSKKLENDVNSRSRCHVFVHLPVRSVRFAVRHPAESKESFKKALDPDADPDQRQ